MLTNDNRTEENVSQSWRVLFMHITEPALVVLTCDYLSRFHFIPNADRLQTSLAWTSNIARCSHVVYSINLYWDMEHYYPNFYRQWLLSFLFFHDATFL